MLLKVWDMILTLGLHSLKLFLFRDRVFTVGTWPKNPRSVSWRWQSSRIRVSRYIILDILVRLHRVNLSLDRSTYFHLLLLNIVMRWNNISVSDHLLMMVSSSSWQSSDCPTNTSFSWKLLRKFEDTCLLCSGTDFILMTWETLSLPQFIHDIMTQFTIIKILEWTLTMIMIAAVCSLRCTSLIHSRWLHLLLSPCWWSTPWLEVYQSSSAQYTPDHQRSPEIIFKVFYHWLLDTPCTSVSCRTYHLERSTVVKLFLPGTQIFFVMFVILKNVYTWIHHGANLPKLSCPTTQRQDSFKMKC